MKSDYDAQQISCRVASKLIKLYCLAKQNSQLVASKLIKLYCLAKQNSQLAMLHSYTHI